MEDTSSSEGGAGGEGAVVGAEWDEVHPHALVDQLAALAARVVAKVAGQRQSLCTTEDLRATAENQADHQTWAWGDVFRRASPKWSCSRASPHVDVAGNGGRDFHGIRAPLALAPSTRRNSLPPNPPNRPRLSQSVGCLRHCSLAASISVNLPQIKDYKQTTRNGL